MIQTPQIQPTRGLDEDSPYADLSHYQDFTPERLWELGFQSQSLRHHAQIIELAARVNNFRTIMHRMGLGLYGNAQGDLLIGATDESLHPHERWLYHMPHITDAWYLIEHHNHVSVFSALMERKLEHAFQTVLGAMYNPIAQAFCQADPSQYWRLFRVPTSLWQNMTEVYSATGFNPVQMHNLLHHYPLWLAEHQEFEGMPPDLVRRMHGLGPSLELVAADKASLPLS